MKLYLLRHAEAEPATGDIRDEERSLTARGHRQIRALTTHMARLRPWDPGEIRHSPLVRAKQTAAEFARALGFEESLNESPLLLPGDEVDALAEWLRDQAGPLTLVGHNPHLERLVASLLGAPTPPLLLKKCSLTCLRRFQQEDGIVWQVHWSLAPRVFRARGQGK